MSKKTRGKNRTISYEHGGKFSKDVQGLISYYSIPQFSKFIRDENTLFALAS